MATKKKVKVEDAAVVGRRKRKSTVVKKRTVKKKVATKKQYPTTKRKAPVPTPKRKPTGTELKRKPTGTELTKRKAPVPTPKKRIPTTVKNKAMKKIAKKVGWAAARRVAASALAVATGPVGWAAVGALTAYELGRMANKKPKPKPKPKKVRVIEKNKPTGGGSIGRTSMKDFKPKSKVETTKKKLKTSRYDPRKANRAGRKFGQRKAGGIIKKMKGGGRIKYI